MTKAFNNRGVQTVIVLVISILIWEVCCRLFNPPIFVLPKPIEILREFLSNPGYFLSNAGYTLGVTLGGFVLAVALGLVLAVAIISSKLVEATIYTLLVTLNSVPKVALAPIFVVWMGTGLSPKVTIALTIAIFPIVIDFVLGLRSADLLLLKLARSARATRFQILFRILIPSALPSMFAGMKVAISLSLVGAIVGEFVAGSDGLGQIILLAQGQFQTTRMFVAIVLLGLMGAILFFIVDLLERLSVPWHVSQRGAH